MMRLAALTFLLVLALAAPAHAAPTLVSLGELHVADVGGLAARRARGACS